jgi:single-strand DNA-binding protein
MALANVTIIGNLGRDPETRYTQNGRMSVYFSIASSRRWTDQNGQQQEKTNWFNVTAWGKQAETLDNLAQQGIIRKGTQLYVSGRIDQRDYVTSDGQPRSSMDVTVNEFQLLGSRADNQGGGYGGRRDDAESGSGAGGGFEPQDIDEIPF